MAEEKDGLVMKFLRKFTLRVSGCLVIFVWKFYFGRWVEGFENLPVKGPAILVANHQSYLDVPLIGRLLQEKKAIDHVSWIVGKKTYHDKALQWFFRFWSIIVVNGTVAKADRALREGRILVVFPEGYYAWYRHKCLKDGKEVLEKKIGTSAAILGLKIGCPIIPIGIHGTEEALGPYAVHFHRNKLGLRIGKPFQFTPPEPEQVTEAMIAEKAKFIMARIDELR